MRNLNMIWIMRTAKPLHMVSKSVTKCIGFFPLECESHKFGPNCSSTCGHCKDGTTCSSVTGDCTGGCEYGWVGKQCDTGK